MGRGALFFFPASYEMYDGAIARPLCLTTISYYFLIHETDPQLRPASITIFPRVVCPSVRPSPLFKTSQTNIFQARIMIATGGTVGLAEWIIDGIHVLYSVISTRNAGYPNDPSLHGLISGLWSSLSGLGRFVSRAGSGFMVERIGFDKTAAVAVMLQAIVVGDTIIYYVDKHILPSMSLC